MIISRNIIMILSFIAFFSYKNSTNYKFNNSIRISSLKEGKKNDSITTIKFKELSVSINDFIIDDEDKKIDKIQKETVEIYAQAGETIEKQLISLSSNLLTDLTIEQRYQTSITISYEGKHCDLTDWKHFNSDWKLLPSNKAGQFIGNQYTETDYKKFPKISIQDLKNKVKEKCGKHWLGILDKVRNTTEYPIEIGISRYYLRITGKRKDNGQKVTKLIIINIPMGC